MAERRYGEAELREIFGKATRRETGEAAAASPAAGFTLAELQSIGLEVGLAPDAVARAAAALDVRPERRRRSLGMPIEVGRVVALPGAPTDREWEQLVAELRATFRAAGRIAVNGNLREWSNGNLHVCIEPAGEGYRLRLGTVKGNATRLNALGLATLVTGAVTAGAAGLSGDPHALFMPIAMAAAGVGALLMNMLRLPDWARRRAEQMERIAMRMRAIMGAPPASFPRAVP